MYGESEEPIRSKTMMNIVLNNYKGMKDNTTISKEEVYNAIRQLQYGDDRAANWLSTSDIKTVRDLKNKILSFDYD